MKIKGMGAIYLIQVFNNAFHTIGTQHCNNTSLISDPHYCVLIKHG